MQDSPRPPPADRRRRLHDAGRPRAPATLSRRAPHLSRRAGRRADRRQQSAPRRGHRRAARRAACAGCSTISRWRAGCAPQRFDLAIDFHGGPRASLLTWLSGAPERIGYDVVGRGWMYTRRVARPRELRPRHSVENQWDLLAPLGIAPPDRVGVSGRDAGRPPRRRGASAERLARRRRRRRRSRSIVDPRQRRQSVPALAGGAFRRARRRARRPAIARRRIVVTSGPSEQRRRRPRHRRRAGAPRPIAPRRVLSCGEFSLGRAARAASTARRSTSAATAARCTSPRRPRADRRPLRSDAAGASAPWRDADAGSAESVDAGDLPCRPCDQRVCEPGDFRCLTSIQPAAGARRRRARAGSAHAVKM